MTTPTTPVELLSVEENWSQYGKMIREIQSNALEWAAEQIRTSHSLLEAEMNLALKHQELCKPKK